MKDAPPGGSWVYCDQHGKGLGQVQYGIGGGSGRVRVRFTTCEVIVHIAVLREATAQEVAVVQRQLSR